MKKNPQVPTGTLPAVESVTGNTSKAPDLDAVHASLVSAALASADASRTLRLSDVSLLDTFKAMADYHDSAAFSAWATTEERAVLAEIQAEGLDNKAAHRAVSSYRRYKAALSFYIGHSAEVLAYDDHVRLAACKDGTTVVPACLDDMSVPRLERARKALEANNASIEKAKSAFDEKATGKAAGAALDVAPGVGAGKAPALPVTLRSEIERLVAEHGIDAVLSEAGKAQARLAERAAAAQAVTA